MKSLYTLLLLAVVTMVAATGAVRASQRALPSRPLTLGSIGTDGLFGGEASRAAALLRRAGMSSVIVYVSWSTAAPAVEPDQWDPTNPTDSHYNWSTADALVKRVTGLGLQPVVAVSDAPFWARLHHNSDVSPPRAAPFGAFMHALAARYSGDTPGLPRARFWQIWNEPNISLFLSPQYSSTTGKFTSPDVYRDMVNAAAASIHAVHSDNVVIAGSTAPFRDITPDVQALDKDWGPLKFMRRFLCVDDAGRPTCSDKVSFDVWATHPYTSGGPTHHAQLPYDVSLGDLSKMHATLVAATKAGHVSSAKAPQFWVNEFSWDSNPPDRCAPPMSLLERWIPEAFYRMWANGVTSISWFKLMDDPMTTSYFQSGLVFHAASLAAAKPKPYLEAFRFPFVALRRGKGVYVWAHTLFGRPARVTVQQLTRRRWKTVTVRRSDRYGIAQAVLNVKPVGQFRGILSGTNEKSLPFSMRVPPDRFFNPFGQPTLLEPNAKACNA